MRIKNLVHWMFSKIPDSVFNQLSKPTFAETDGVAQAQMLLHRHERCSAKDVSSVPRTDKEGL
ncbi:Uncharacterised protein [Serratia liquefaciens]|nr:Uncharacterised protein [Serratia liquefaciens]